MATAEARVGEVLAMPIRPGVFFEPEVIGLVSEALEAACKLLPTPARMRWYEKSWPDELLQWPVLVSATEFACAPPRLLVATRNWLKRTTCVTLARNP